MKLFKLIQITLSAVAGLLGIVCFIAGAITLTPHLLLFSVLFLVMGWFVNDEAIKK